MSNDIKARGQSSVPPYLDAVFVWKHPVSNSQQSKQKTKENTFEETSFIHKIAPKEEKKTMQPMSNGPQCL